MVIAPETKRERKRRKKKKEKGVEQPVVIMECSLGVHSREFLPLCFRWSRDPHRKATMFSHLSFHLPRLI